jgi:hypothetical protein
MDWVKKLKSLPGAGPTASVTEAVAVLKQHGFGVDNYVVKNKGHGQIQSVVVVFDWVPVGLSKGVGVNDPTKVNEFTAAWANKV